jgi:integrase
MIRWKTWYEAENRAREEAKLNRIKRPIQKRPHWVVSEAMADALGMLFHSGLRSWEVKAMMWQDIDLESGIVTVLETKKGANPTNEITHKRVSISGEALKILMHIPKTSVWVFPSKGRNKNSASGHIENLQDTWERIRTHLGIQGIRLHDYRHTAATELGKSPSMGPKELQQGMGWETTATAMKYLHTDDAICKNEMEIASEQRMERVRNAPKTGPVTVGDSSKPEVNSKQRKRGKIKNPLAGLSIDLAKGKASNVDSTASRPE